MSVKLTEITYDLISAEIQSKIAAALADVSADRGDKIVSTPPPKKYFKYAFAKGYETPCVYVICNSHKINNAERNANYLNTTAKVHVSVLIEDRIKDNLVLKSWRYQAALFKILHETSLTTVDNLVKIVVKVDEMLFSPEFSDTNDRDATGSVFRKEVVLSCNVEHYENL